MGDGRQSRIAARHIQQLELERVAAVALATLVLLANFQAEATKSTPLAESQFSPSSCGLLLVLRAPADEASTISTHARSMGKFTRG